MAKQLNDCGEHQISLIFIFSQSKTLSVSINIWQKYPEEQTVNSIRLAFPRDLSRLVQVLSWNVSSFKLARREAHTWGYVATSYSGSIRPREQGQCPLSHYLLSHHRTLNLMVSTPLPHQFDEFFHVSCLAGHTILAPLGTSVWLGFMTNFNYLEGKNIFPLCNLKYLIKEMWSMEIRFDWQPAIHFDHFC